ncbi:MAG: CHAT domain-containing protein [Cyclobacteriaceae bacterium]|nr:CHAT domain-containing protein [Cyclobacteriaceae bacterium]
MKKLLLLPLLLFSLTTFAQDDWANKLLKKAGEEGSRQKAAIDSIDFPFAITVSDNAGLFDIRQKGETVSKGLYLLKERTDKTPIEIARDTLDQAIFFYNKRMYKIAEASFMEAKAFMENNGLANDINYLRCISNLGVVYLAQGKLNDAELYINGALEESKARGTGSVAYVANLNNKAKLEQAQGSYNEAEQHFNEALPLVEKIFGGGLQPAIVLNNKAMLMQALGRNNEAIETMKLSIAASEASAKNKVIKDKGSFDNRRFQSNLAYIYQAAGKLTEAESLFLSQKKIYENRGNANNPEYAALLNQLALLYMQMNKLSEVEPLLNKAIAVYKKKNGEESTNYAKALSDLGMYYRISGKNDLAIQNLTKALSLKEKILNANHPEFIKTKEELAIAYWKSNQIQQAYTHYKEVMEKTLFFIDQYFPPMSEAEKTAYWDITSPRFQRFYNFALQNLTQQPELAADVYNYHIATKALLLNSTNKIKQIILNGKDVKLKQDYISWLNKKELLARYYALSKDELKEQNIDLKTLEAEANALEKMLSGKSADFAQGYAINRITFDELAKLLQDNEALLEIIRIHSYEQIFTDQALYAALVLTKGTNKPSVIVLENGKQLETRYAKYYRNTIQQKQVDEYSYQQFWAKFEPVLNSKKNIYLSVDGVYNQINLNTLKKPDGTFLLQQYEIALLGNTKDFIDIKKRKITTAKKNAVLLGFPEFGAAEPAALPGTKIELENISKNLKAAGYTTQLFQQREASEKNIKNVKAPEILHIATHGYFLQDVEGQDDAFGVASENATRNPLLRSGLLLTDAGKTMSKQASADLSSNDNGILTAYEAMNLNLEGTDMVVLSACETGLGDVKNGEGVYGLQRSFLVAGADAMLMSLWKVDDAATQLLMSSFYANWIKLRDKQKAFKQAQLQLYTKYKDPYYWGAFVMIGL